MSATASTICLSMIVKNEAHVIARCLASVRRFLTHWVIVDTGSTDDTRAVIARALEGIPGELHERPWRGFGENRTEALELARSNADYLLVVDADDTLELPPDIVLPPLHDDSYALRVEDCELSYYRIHLMRSALPWRYEGVLHEYAVCEAAKTRGVLDGLVYRRNYDGARSSDPLKYAKDAALLEEALKRDPTNARNVFYLAQSYRDAGALPEALLHYNRRAAMGGWDEEVFFALYQIAQLHERMGQEASLVWASYLRAHRARPVRAEALCDLARFCRLSEDHALAHVFASAAVALPRPQDVLFVDDSAYEWRALDEYAIASYYVGRHKEALEANRRLLTEGKLPASEVERVTRNTAFSEGKP